MKKGSKKGTTAAGLRASLIETRNSVRRGALVLAGGIALHYTTMSEIVRVGERYFAVTTRAWASYARSVEGLIEAHVQFAADEGWDELIDSPVVTTERPATKEEKEALRAEGALPNTPIN